MRRGRLAIVAAFFAVFSLFVGSDAESQGRFDGLWKVFISGSPGACQFGYRISVKVRDGLVSWQGHPIDPSVVGIAPGGTVAIRLTDGRHLVTGSGAIGRRVGYGKWSAPAFRCTGRWDAIRL
jgi:hypothetical protein